MADGPAVLFVNLRRTKREQLESLLAARRLGYEIVMLAARVPDHLRPLIKEVAIVDSFDGDRARAAAQELARRHDLRGVASWTESDVELVAGIAAMLGLPSMPVAAAHKARHKFAMKQALAHIDGLLPRFALVRTTEDLAAAVESVGLPAVLKPTGASGSTGIFELRRPADVEPALAQLRRIARPEFDSVFRYFGAEFILEELVAGPEVSVEGFVSGGRTLVVGITDKWTTDPFHLEYQHVFPTRLPQGVRGAVERMTGQVVQTLGLDNCAFHLETKIVPQGFRFMEVGARAAGDYIASHLVPAACGIDFYANVIRVATGQALDLTPRERLHAGIRYVLAERPGRLARLMGMEGFMEHPASHHLFLEVPLGTEIKLPPDNFRLQRVAALIARHSDYQALTDLLDQAAAEVRPVIGEVPVRA
jgi:biotin carboxylase